MEAELRAHLLALADAYSTATKMTPATVAQRAMGDWRFFRRLEEDQRASFTVRKYDAALAWFASNWPADAVWPADIERPAVTSAPAVAA